MARNQVRLDIKRREPFAGGGSFGNTGPYERLFGKAHFAIDPDEKGLPSIEERYPSHAAYIAAVTRVCEERVREGLMLQEDADRFIDAARQKNPLDPSVRLGPLIQAGA